MHPRDVERAELENLVGAAEIADRLGVASSTLVHDWRRRDPSFPQPVRHLRMGYIWWWPDVREWARATGRWS